VSDIATSLHPQTSFYILSAFSNCSCWLLALENRGHRLFCYYRERFSTEICRVGRAELRRLKVAETEQGRAWIWKPATRARHSGILVLRCTPALKLSTYFCFGLIQPPFLSKRYTIYVESNLDDRLPLSSFNQCQKNLDRSHGVLMQFLALSHAQRPRKHQ